MMEFGGASILPFLVESCPSCGELIERAPQQPVDADDEERHDGDSKRNSRIIPGLRHARDVRTETHAVELRRAPAHRLRNDACVPCAPGCRDGACDVVGKYAGQYDVAPPA